MQPIFLFLSGSVLWLDSSHHNNTNRSTCSPLLLLPLAFVIQGKCAAQRTIPSNGQKTSGKAQFTQKAEADLHAYLGANLWCSLRWVNEHSHWNISLFFVSAFLCVPCEQQTFRLDPADQKSEFWSRISAKELSHSVKSTLPYRIPRWRHNFPGSQPHERHITYSEREAGFRFVHNNEQVFQLSQCTTLQDSTMSLRPFIIIILVAALESLWMEWRDWSFLAPRMCWCIPPLRRSPLAPEELALIFAWKARTTHETICGSWQHKTKCSGGHESSDHGIHLRPHSHRIQSNSQQAYANYGTHCGQWECSHRLQATSKSLLANLHANLLMRPVWTGPRFAQYTMEVHWFHLCVWEYAVRNPHESFFFVFFLSRGFEFCSSLYFGDKTFFGIFP